MVVFRIKIAGYIFEVNANFEWSKKFCEGYLTDENYDYSITVTKQDIEYEKEAFIKEYKIEDRSKLNYSDGYMENLAIYRKIAEILIDNNIMLFHGSAVAVDGVCYLFTAKSGTGKTTHTQFWVKNVKGAYIVNGDKPLIKVTDKGVFVCGTPWRGKERFGVNEIVPLKAICVLERDLTDHIEKTDVSAVLPIMLQQSYRPTDSLKMIKTLEIIDVICRKVKFYKLGCTMNESSAIISYNGMKD